MVAAQFRALQSKLSIRTPRPGPEPRIFEYFNSPPWQNLHQPRKYYGDVQRTQVHPTRRPRSSGLVATKAGISQRTAPSAATAPRRSVAQSVDPERRNAIAQRYFSRPESGTAALMNLAGREQRQAPTFAGGRPRDLRCACGMPPAAALLCPACAALRA